MNSLVIVADAASARLFRTAKISDAEAGAELVEVGALEASASTSEEALSNLAKQIAARAAEFAHHHFCNPFIVVASSPVSMVICRELERQLPNAHVRRVTGDLVRLPLGELMQQLQERAAFTPLPARTPGQIEL